MQLPWSGSPWIYRYLPSYGASSQGNGGLNLIFQNQVQSRPTDVRILIEGKCIETPNIFYYRHLLQSNPLQRSEGTACVPWLGD
jgi:hypothetical protein